MSDYRNQRIALLTQHGKEQVIAPVLDPALGCRVERVDGFDTDRLGTFTRETPRPGTQHEAARRKARLAIELSGANIGLGSEGSFTPDPYTGLFPWNLELLVLIDDRLGIEVAGIAQGPGRSSHLLTDDWPAVEAFAAQEGFPAHRLILRPDNEDDPRIRKDLADRDALRQAFEACAATAQNGQVFVETDLRAFANPTRMTRIGDAARDLLQRLQTPCPVCSRPGFGLVGREGALPCAACGRPTGIPAADVRQCPACGHREATRRTDQINADPRHCPACNP